MPVIIRYKAFIDTPTRDGMIELRINGRGKDERAAVRDCQQQVRSFINNLTYHMVEINRSEVK